MDYLKIQELRASVLNDLQEFIPKNHYINIHSDEQLFAEDFRLAMTIKYYSHYTNPKLTPRQYCAVYLLENIGLYGGADYYKPEDAEADQAKEITIESSKKTGLHFLQAALNRYAEHLNPDEARALLKNHAWISVTESTPGTTTKTSNGEVERSEIEIPAWQEKARQKADEIYLYERKNLKTDPSRKAIAEKIEKIFEDEGVVSIKGKRLTADYIHRHALNNWQRPKI